MTVLATVAAGVILFTLTDLDDLIVLVAFFSDPRYSALAVVAGQFAGMAAILAVSVAASLLALATPTAAIGLLGLVPIGLGVYGVVRLLRGEGHDDSAAVSATSPGRATAVAAVTFANGGDNIATYGPYLAARGPGEILLFALVVFGMTALWCGTARFIVRHPAVVAAVGRIGPRLLPFALIGIGLSVLWREDTLSLLGLR